MTTLDKDGNYIPEDPEKMITLELGSGASNVEQIKEALQNTTDIAVGLGSTT